MFTLQSKSIVDNLKAGIGADIVVVAARMEYVLQHINPAVVTASSGIVLT